MSLIIIIPDIIIPVPSQIRLSNSIRLPAAILETEHRKEFERFKSMGINSYSFGGGGSYLMGGNL